VARRYRELGGRVNGSVIVIVIVIVIGVTASAR
jgi:hypothetical protein